MSQLCFVFQFHYLLPELTALENVLMPARKQGKHQTLEKEARALLEQFEVGHAGSRNRPRCQAESSNEWPLQEL